MIHQRKSPRTSYIERSGRGDFEWNTFEIPARIEGVPEGFGSSETWRIKEARELNKSLVQNRDRRAELFGEKKGGGGGKRKRGLGHPAVGSIYTRTVRAGWSDVRLDHPDMTRKFLDTVAGSSRVGPDHPEISRFGWSEVWSDHPDLLSKVLAENVGWSRVGPDHPGLSREFLPIKIDLIRDFVSDMIENNVWTYKILNSKWSGTINNT